MEYVEIPFAESETGNAEALQKIEIEGLDEEDKVWAWKTFKAIAKNLSKQNYFSQDEATDMESEAMVRLLADQASYWPSSSTLTLHERFAGIINRKLRQAAAKIADERSIWTESCQSLDADNGSDEDNGNLINLVTSESNLSVNRKLITPPRAIAIRNKIKRLQNEKKYEELNRFRLAIKGISAKSPLIAVETDENQDEEDKEKVLPLNEDDEMPQRTFKLRSLGFGNMTRVSEGRELKFDVKHIRSRLSGKMKKWCLEVMNGEDPVETYKTLGIRKSYYYKHMIPLLRNEFKELSGTW